MSFPKLPKTPLDTNEFNYNRWTDTTCKVKLCSVPWQENYENVVEFSSKTERDQYFDGLQGNDIQLNSGFRVVDNVIKLPIPYFNCIRFNYVIINYPIPTSQEQPIDYATLEPKTLKYFYFITDIEDIAPNTSKVYLKPDIWTQWYYDIEIKSLYLKRGHYAVKHSAKPSEYIKNPINSTDYLLAPEQDIPQTKQKQDSLTFAPYFSQDSELYAVFTLPFNIEDILNNTNIVPTTPYFETDPDNRNGYEVLPIFNLPQIGQISYTDLNAANNLINMYYYAVKMIDIPLLSEKENILITQNIKALYILSTDYIDLVPIDNVFYTAIFKTRNISVNTETLLQEYANKVEGFTKLLTSPYCSISITDYNTTFDIDVQACTSDINIINNIIFNDGNIKGISRVTNIDASSNESIYIRQINGIQEYKTFYNSFDYDFIFNIDLPVYGLFIDSSSKNYAKKAFENTIKERDLKTNYENSARKINNNYENTIDSTDTDLDNNLRSNATTNTNALNSNATAYNNAINSAACARDNALRSNANAQTTADNSALNSENVALNSNQVNYDNVVRTNSAVTANSVATQSKNTGVLVANVGLNTDNYNVNTARNTASTNAQNALQSALTDINKTASVAQAITGSISHAISGDLGGALLGAVSTAISVDADTAKSNAIIGNNSAMLSATISIDTDATGYSNTALQNINLANNTLIQTTTTNTVNASNQNATDTKTANDANATATYNTSTTNNALNKATNDTNATDNYTTATTNAGNTKSTADANANNTKSTADTNTTNSTATTQANALYTRDTDLTNLQRSLTKDVANINYETLNNNVDVLTAQSLPSLNTITNLYTQGFIVSVNGLKQDDLDRVTAIFNRYGYMSNGYKIVTLNIEKLQCMNKYSYIECEDVTILNKTVPSKYAIIIGDILKHGTTVWSNPDFIGDFTENMGE